MRKGFTLLFSFVLLVTIESCNDKNISGKNIAATSVNTTVSGKEFVANLDRLGYFKYANTKDINSLKKDMAESYNPDATLTSIWDDQTGTPKDYRLYLCDGETLFELGGFEQMLSELQPTFKKIGLKIDITNHVEDWDDKNKWLNHSVDINGRHYTILKDFVGTGWGEAAQTFADILNHELSLQSKEDRIYLISGGNEGEIVFLNPAQFKYIDSVYTNNQWKPLEVNDWCKAMDVKPQKYSF